MKVSNKDFIKCDVCGKKINWVSDQRTISFHCNGRPKEFDCCQKCINGYSSRKKVFKKILKMMTKGLQTIGKKNEN